MYNVQLHDNKFGNNLNAGLVITYRKLGDGTHGTNAIWEMQMCQKITLLLER
jgi:hypothetical protein